MNGRMGRTSSLNPLLLLMLNDPLGVHSVCLSPGILELGEHVRIWLLLPFVILQTLVVLCHHFPNYWHMKVPPDTLIDLLGIFQVWICLA